MNGLTTENGDKLSAKVRAKWEKLFKMFDTSNKGSFGVQELSSVVKAYGMSIPDQELRELIAEMDINDTESVTFDDFVKVAVKKIKDSNAEEALREAFKVFDRDGNGFLSVEELRHAMQTLDDNQMTNEELDEMVAEVDVNDYHEINYEELITLMTSVPK